MDKEMPPAPMVEAVAEDIALQDEDSQQHQHHHSLDIDETHTSFFQDDRALDVAQDQHSLEPPSPPQRASRPDVAAEDLQLSNHGDDQIQQLQLAAQMSQALREVVGSSTAATENTYDSQQEANLSSLRQLQGEEPDADMHAPAPGMPEAQGLPELSDTQDLQQTLEQVIPHHEHQQEAQPQHTSHSSMSQHDHYLDGSAQPTLAPAVLVGGTQTQYALTDVTPPRKRSKVSRACDECRRKKIKCDASSETGEEICSNCRRSNVRCMFSRVPQKRGPSKGYIKELADRINSIEGKLGGQSVAEALAGELAARRGNTESYAFVPQTDDTRKRPFSNISNTSTNATFSTPQPSRPQGWSADPRPVINQQPTYSANGLALKPILPRETISAPSRSPGVDSSRASVPVVQQTPPAPSQLRDNVYHA